MNVASKIEAAPVATDHDLYYAVHKGIRLANARMLIALGQADAGNDAEVDAVLEMLSRHLELSLGHLSHENAKIHAVVEARIPGGASHQGEDHDHHLAAFEELRRIAEDVASATHDRAAKLRRLYMRFALFMADDLQHMHEEETELMPLIAQNFSKPEIEEIERSIVTEIPVPKMAAFGRFMLGAASRPERIAMVTGMAHGMPAEPFGWLMTTIVGRPWVLGDWSALEEAVC